MTTIQKIGEGRHVIFDCFLDDFPIIAILSKFFGVLRYIISMVLIYLYFSCRNVFNTYTRLGGTF